MNKRKIEILSTKILDEGFASGHLIIDEIPFIDIKYYSDEILNKKIELLLTQNINAVFTSANAVNAIAKFIAQKPAWKIFCIGNKTKENVSKYFDENAIEDVAETATGLARKIIKNISIKNITFFCGNQRRNELPEILIQNGIDIEEVLVYETILTPVIIQKEYDGILFFSPSAVTSFFSVNQISKNPVCFAIGQTTADAIEKNTSNKIIIAENASQAGISGALNSYFKKMELL